MVPVGEGIGLMKSELDVPVEMSGMFNLSGFSKWAASRPLVVSAAVSFEHLITLELNLPSSGSRFNCGATSSIID